MFFLIKSGFWLSIVFSCMTWPGHEGPRAVALQTASELGSRAQTVLVQKAGAACSANPRECLTLVQRATAAPQPSGVQKPARAERPN